MYFLFKKCSIIPPNNKFYLTFFLKDHVMKISDLPNSSKPRERFLEKGAEALSDAELMAIILRTGTIEENVVEMSNRLLSEYSLENLFDCSLKELQNIKGIGPSKAMQLLAMAELGKRYNHFYERLKDKKQENFYVLLLNTQNHIIKEELISQGVLDAAILHPREVFKPAIKNSAKKLILIHNHPSGNPQPSQEDLTITKQLIEAGNNLDIKVLDHIIIGNPGEDDKGFWSWKENENN